jgi:hypothetical protein
MPEHAIAHPLRSELVTLLAASGDSSDQVRLSQTLSEERQDAVQVRLVRPDLGRTVMGWSLPSDAIPRDRVSAPIAPELVPTDQVLFEDVADPTKQYYLPRYRVSGRQQFQIQFAQTQGGWSLTIDLEKYPALQIEQAARGAAEVAHAVSATLAFDLLLGGSAGGRKELVFQEVTMLDSMVRVVLRGVDLVERGMVYAALTERAYATTLTLRRELKLAVPLPRLNPADSTARSILQLDPNGRPILITSRPSPPFRPVLRLADAGRLERAAPVMDAPAVPLFQEAQYVFEEVVEPRPFVFAGDLYAYIFRNVTAGSGFDFEPIRHQVPWHGRAFSYFQDRGDLGRFYYLPDSFKLARRPSPPHQPTMSVRFSTGDAPLDALQARLDYIAVPFVDTDRLAAAGQVLQRHVPSGGAVRFEPLVHDVTRFRLALPSTNAAAGPFQDRPGALVDLRGGIRDSLTLSVDELRQVYEALFSPSAQLLTGQVDIEMGTLPAEHVPFEARVFDVVGPLLEQPDPIELDSRGILASVRNAIESPLRINRLLAQVEYGGARVGASVQPETAPFPIELRPGEGARLLVTPAEIPAAAQAPQVIFDQRGVEVVASSEAVWQAIFDPTITSTYLSQVTVRVAALFTSVLADGRQAVTIGVAFAGGNVLIFKSDQLEGTGQIRMPITDYVLQRVSDASYRYQVTIEYASGSVWQSEWLSDNSPLLSLSTDRIRAR